MPPGSAPRSTTQQSKLQRAKAELKRLETERAAET